MGTFIDSDGADCAAIGGEKCDRYENIVDRVDRREDVTSKGDGRIEQDPEGPERNR